tara:strand:+ start:6562 stop:6762 length:201 start_codon:yes stop_codon:yes gene_type:complete
MVKFEEILDEEVQKYWDKNYPCRSYLDVETDIYEGSLEPIKEAVLRIIDIITNNKEQFEEFKKLIK